MMGQVHQDIWISWFLLVSDFHYRFTDYLDEIPRDGFKAGEELIFKMGAFLEAQRVLREFEEKHFDFLPTLVNKRDKTLTEAYP